MTIGNRSVKNAIWIIACKLVQSVLNVLVTMLTARFFGPSNYGLIHYAASVVAFAAPIMRLGLSSTLVQEFINDPEHEGETLGTALCMNLVSAAISMAGVAAFTAITNPGEKTTLIVCVLYSLNLPVQALEMTQYWFQAKLKARYTSVTMLCAYLLVSLYKLFLLVTGRSIYWFAVSQTMDYLIISLVLLVIYRKIGGQKLSVSLQRGREMLSRSRYYIVSSLMITMFAQTDKIMLKMMLGNEVTGCYSAAVTCAGMTSFVFAAIIDSAKPLILEAKKKSQSKFEHDLTVLYSLVMFLGLAQSGAIAVFADPVIRILYGAAYKKSVDVLRLVVWYTPFSYLGAARTVWVLGEEKHGLLWRINLYGAVANIALNATLIPLWGAMGAALASLITQMVANVLIGFIIPALRGNTRLILQGLHPKHLIGEVKQLLKTR